MRIWRCARKSASTAVSSVVLAAGSRSTPEPATGSEELARVAPGAAPESTAKRRAGGFASWVRSDRSLVLSANLSMANRTVRQAGRSTVTA